MLLYNNNTTKAQLTTGRQLGELFQLAKKVLQSTVNHIYLTKTTPTDYCAITCCIT